MYIGKKSMPRNPNKTQSIVLDKIYNRLANICMQNNLEDKAIRELASLFMKTRTDFRVNKFFEIIESMK